jgi:putative transposase
MYAALIRAAERWRGIRITEFEQRQLGAIRDEIDKDFAARNAPAATAPHSHLSSNQRTLTGPTNIAIDADIEPGRAN